jgi:acyl carrier protein
MSDIDLEKKILYLINDVLKIKNKINNINTHIVDIPEWDSLGNVRVILELESIFSISILLSEIDEISTINSLVKLVMKKS